MMVWSNPNLLTVVDFKITQKQYDDSKPVGHGQWKAADDYGCTDRFGASPETCKHQHEEGSPAEKAISLWLDLPWTGAQNWRRGKGEIGEDLQSRLRLSVEHPDLGFRHNDDPQQIFILVHKPLHYAPLLFRFVGWMTGAQGMQDRYIQQRNPNRWFVPPSQLHPILQLPHLGGRVPAGWITKVWLP
jgi:hypothetical protein